MKRLLIIYIALTGILCSVRAQIDDSKLDGFNEQNNTFNPHRALDSLSANHKEVPKGLYEWTIDERFGDTFRQTPDTAQHLFMNTFFTMGKHGEYNTTGNLGAPRIARIATDRDLTAQMPFLEPYGYFLTKPSELRYTNTLSPITNLTYGTCGNRTNGEDHLRAMFATNINKQAGFGFLFNYLYGRGYYQNQSTALFDYTMWGSYIGERYQAHLSFSFDHMKTTENGGITDDEFITHPEATSETYTSNEIPVMLNSNWNRNDAFHLSLSHRYNVGFYRKVPMTEQEKEAKRFALKAKKEKEEQEAAAMAASSGTTTVVGRPAGRPDDAKIMGTLPTDSLREAMRLQAEQQKLALADSLLAQSEKVEEDTSWLKDEYVPVTSFIHTAQLQRDNRAYIAYRSPADFYMYTHPVPDVQESKDSINDETRYYSLRNTLAIGLLEGFNKYVPMGGKVFIAHELRHYELPQIGSRDYKTYNEMNISAGAQLIKTTGKVLNYRAMGEFWLVGEDIGDLRLDGEGDVRFRLRRDTVSVALKAFYHLTNPVFLQRHYSSRHFAWDHDGLNKQMQTHLEGVFCLQRTRTTLRFAYDNIQNYAYLGVNYSRKTATSLTGYTADVMQSSKNISLLTASLEQSFRYRAINWETRLTFQKSSAEEVLPVPALNVWTNLYLNFRIAKVLRVHFGADMTYFSSYYAPEYCPQLGQFAVQQNDEVKTEVGNYPIINVYANFQLKKCRFFVMMTHVNAGSGNRRYFLVPHHPINENVLHFGLNWTFHN